MTENTIVAQLAYVPISTMACTIYVAICIVCPLDCIQFNFHVHMNNDTTSTILLVHCGPDWKGRGGMD